MPRPRRTDGPGRPSEQQKVQCTGRHSRLSWRLLDIFHRSRGRGIIGFATANLLVSTFYNELACINFLQSLKRLNYV